MLAALSVWGWAWGTVWAKGRALQKEWAKAWEWEWGRGWV
jgi:hypothetical protein